MYDKPDYLNREISIVVIVSVSPKLFLSLINSHPHANTSQGLLWKFWKPLHSHVLPGGGFPGW